MKISEVDLNKDEIIIVDISGDGIEELVKIMDREGIKNSENIRIGYGVYDNNVNYRIRQSKITYADHKFYTKEPSHSRLPRFTMKQFFNEFFYKNKTKMIIEKTYEVEESFIKLAYKAACSKWKRRLEEKFPDLFETYLKIGDKLRHNRGSIYIVSKVGVNFYLVSLEDGMTYREDPVSDLTLSSLTKGNIGYFTKI